MQEKVSFQEAATFVTRISTQLNISIVILFICYCLVTGETLDGWFLYVYVCIIMLVLVPYAIFLGPSHLLDNVFIGGVAPFCNLLLFSPIIISLTSNVSTDSILFWAISGIIVGSVSVVIWPVYSQNASMFATILLASELKSISDVILFLTLAIVVLVLFKNLYRETKYHLNTFWATSLAAIVFTSCECCVHFYIILMVIVNAVFPWLYVLCQGAKMDVNNI